MKSVPAVHETARAGGGGSESVSQYSSDSTRGREAIRARCQEPAFSPTASFEMLPGDPRVFRMRRRRGDRSVDVFVNLSGQSVEEKTPPGVRQGEAVELIRGKVHSSPRVVLEPYGVQWIARGTTDGSRRGTAA